jgi:hypothetical protein
MATKNGSPKYEHQGSAEGEHASPKKRRKVNHGRYDAHFREAALFLTDACLDSVCILPAIGKQAIWGQHYLDNARSYGPYASE